MWLVIEVTCGATHSIDGLVGALLFSECDRRRRGRLFLSCYDALVRLWHLVQYLVLAEGLRELADERAVWVGGQLI